MDAFPLTGLSHHEDDQQDNFRFIAADWIEGQALVNRPAPIFHPVNRLHSP